LKSCRPWVEIVKAMLNLTERRRDERGMPTPTSRATGPAVVDPVPILTVLPRSLQTNRLAAPRLWLQGGWEGEGACRPGSDVLVRTSFVSFAMSMSNTGLVSQVRNMQDSERPRR
jgi:hypothetical protein